MKTLIIEIDGQKISPTYCQISVRGNHSEKWKDRTTTHCSICGGMIDIGDHYIVRNGNSINGYASWCLNCVKIAPGDEFYDLSF